MAEKWSKFHTVFQKVIETKAKFCKRNHVILAKILLFCKFSWFSLTHVINYELMILLPILKIASSVTKCKLRISDINKVLSIYLICGQTSFSAFISSENSLKHCFIRTVTMKKSMALGRDYIISINDSDLKVGLLQKYSVKAQI